MRYAKDLSNPGLFSQRRGEWNELSSSFDGSIESWHETRETCDMIMIMIMIVNMNSMASDEMT